jgi:flagellar capping protein FliD
VRTKALKQAVNRNRDRFPEDFMFELDRKELSEWRSQFVTSNFDKMGLRWSPYAFTEQGVAMLSSVLKSKRAVRVNIAIMRAFVKLRRLISSHKELARRIEHLEKSYSKHEIEMTTVFKVLKKLMEPPPAKPAKRIGFVS